MINIILQSLFINIVYFIIIRNLGRLWFPLFRFLLIMAVSAVFMTILCLNPMLSGFSNITNLCFGAFFILLQTKSLLSSFFYSIIGMLIMFVANIFSAMVFYIIFGNASVIDYENLLHLFSLYSIGGVMAYIISKLLGLLIHKKIKNLFAQLKRKYIIYLSIGILIVLLFFYYQFFLAQYLIEDPFIRAVIGVAFSVAYLVFLLVAVHIFITGIRKSIETAHKQELLNQLQDYTLNLESMYTDMRKFRHDYMNIIAALYGYIAARNLDGLEQYFTNSIVPIEKRIERTDSTLDRLKNIQILEVKGLVALKLMHAQESGASVHIEVPENINLISCDIINLTRIIGIFIDNAIEACLETEGKILKFALFDQDNLKVIIVANSFQNSIPSITEIYKDGFSTKGKKHGLGLFTVRQIIDQNNNITLNTHIEDGLFVQELKILDNLMGGV